MSALCGLANWDGLPLQLDQLTQMLTALAHHGIDGTGRWQQRGVALGHQTLHITEESRGEQQPIYDDATSLAITADVRLDNRAELFEQLQIPQREGASWSDSRLLLAAYQRWGEAMPRYLLGDFAFALWDSRRRKLLCCRDHLGIRPLFYHYRAGCFAFASEAKGILPILPAIRLNKRKTALLAYQMVMKEEVESTFFEDVFGLPAATLLIADEQGIRQQCYWEPDRHARLDINGDEEVLEALQGVVFEAVRARLRSAFPVTALLSGGLDSSAIVSVAAQCLAEEGKRLTTFSSVLPQNDASVADLTDERAYIEQFQAWPAIDLHYVTAPQQGPFDTLERLIQLYECPMATNRHYLYTAFAAAARNAGARVILDGAGGELGLTYHGEGCYAEWLLRGQWSTLWRELTVRSQLQGASPWQLFRTQLLKPLLPEGLAQGARAVVSNQRPEAQLSHVLQSSFLTRQLGQEHDQWGQRQRAMMRTRLYHRDHQAAALCRARKPSRVAGFIGYEQVAMRYPLQDKRLLEFCLAAPSELKIRDGYNRYLVRGSLDQILPPKIQWRTSKQPFSPDFHLRYNRQRMQAVAFFSTIKPADPVREVVDIEQLKLLAAHDLPTAHNDGWQAHAAGHLVPQGMYLIAFLRQFDEYRP